MVGAGLVLVLRGRGRQGAVSTQKRSPCARDLTPGQLCSFSAPFPKLESLPLSAKHGLPMGHP